MRRLSEILIDLIPYVKKKNKTLKWYNTSYHKMYENWKIQCEKNRELEKRLKNERKNVKNNK